MHATHQFFLTKRSLYLLVWDARQEDRYGQIDYWLKLIQSFGGGSPVIVVLNKVDEHSIDLNRREISKKYSNVKGFVRTSCKDNINIDLLNNLVSNETNKLPHIEDEMLDSWFEIKIELEQMPSDFIEYSEYKEMCELKGIDELSQETLISFLHDLGVVLNFKNDLRLRDTNILNPEWVTNGVYQILNHGPLQGTGILECKMLNIILDTKKYPAHKHQFILNMMKKFELCFEFEAIEHTFLIPELLPEETPDLKWNFQNCLSFQYQYDFFSRSIISRFIVRMHPFIKENKYWKSGVLIADKNNSALVKADRDERTIYIWVTGQENTKRDFLAKIRSQFEYIHSTFPKIETKEMIPMPEYPGVVVEYEHLLNLEEMNEETFIPTGLKKRVNVKQLLDGIRMQSDDVLLERVVPITELIKQGENSSIEFKCALQWDKHQNRKNKDLHLKSLEAITAFLNSQGGTLLIGVNDDGSIFGIENDLSLLGDSSLDMFEQKLMNLVHDHIGPVFAGSIRVRFESLEGKSVCAIDVNKASKSAFLKRKGNKQYFVRLGNTSRLLDPEEMLNYIKLQLD